MQLLRTAQEVTAASLFARFADKRDVMGSAPASIYALTPLEHGAPVRVDFTADTGDGFDATFAVARLLAGGLPAENGLPTKDGLPAASGLPAEGGQPAEDRRPAKDGRVAGSEGVLAGPAELLVLGGDEVYPVASAEAYRRRFTAVFRAARFCYPQFIKSTSPVHGPPVLALPGNHDWYDGLSAFRRTFCESWTRMTAKADSEDLTMVGLYEDPKDTAQREVAGGWTTIQSRSYFAIRVHPKWWIWGVDSQLNAPIDSVQLAYFDAAKAKLQPGDGVVLCTSTPSWLEAEDDNPQDFDRETPMTTMVNFRRRYLGLPEDEWLRMIVTGDRHHYVRYEATKPQPAETKLTGGKSLKWMPGPTLVTCGGGGAFTSPTHHLKEKLSVPWGRQRESAARPVTRYERCAPYPSLDDSRKLRRGIWTMGLHNGPGLPAVIGALLTCVFWTVAGRPFDEVVRWPSIIAWIVLAVLTYAYALTGIRGRRGRSWKFRLIKVGIAAVMHTLVHLLAIALVAWLVWEFNGDGRPLWLLLAYLPFVILGTAVFTVYLVVSDLFGYHETEAFASTRSEKYKSVLRLTFTNDEVTVDAIGLDRVPSTRRATVSLDDCPLVPRQVDHFMVRRREEQSSGGTPPETGSSDVVGDSEGVGEAG